MLWRLTTFTYQANVLAAAYYSWTLYSGRADDQGGLRGAAVLYDVVAGILWNLLLTTYSMGYTPANILLHNFLDPDSVGVTVVAANIGLLALFVLVLGYGISAVGAVPDRIAAGRSALDGVQVFRRR